MKLFIRFFLLIFAVSAFYAITPPLNVERYFSPVEPKRATPNGFAAIRDRPHQFIADMHADTLLWSRDILERSDIGHADLQRLLEADVGLQIFMSVIEAPSDTESSSIIQDSDQITPITILDKWPLRSISSYKERALYQAEKLVNAAEASEGRLKVILNSEDLKGLVSWSKDRTPLHAILGLEGAHATEFDVDNLSDLYEAGFRTMELAHYSDTAFAGSSTGLVKYGLTAKGEQLVKRMNQLGMIIDVAHLSPPAIVDVLALSDQAVFSSHTGVFATCPHPRNLSDDLIKRIAEQKGIIGIGFFQGALCDMTLDSLIKSILYATKLVGSEYVALGSGWDIAELVIRPEELPKLESGLLDAGLTGSEVDNIMGLNVLRFFQKNLPTKVTQS